MEGGHQVLTARPEAVGPASDGRRWGALRSVGGGRGILGAALPSAAVPCLRCDPLKPALRCIEHVAEFTSDLRHDVKVRREGMLDDPVRLRRCTRTRYCVDGKLQE